MKFSKVRDVKTPIRSTKFSAGWDFFIPNDIGWDMKILHPGEDINISSGIKVNIPDYWMLCGFNKSGLALKGLDVGAGIIDSDYTGIIHLHVRNISNFPIEIKAGEKLVQYLLMPVCDSPLEEVDEEELFKDKISERGNGGFGSTSLI